MACQIAEHFATCVIDAYGSNCVVVLSSPWSGDTPPPAGIFCATANATLNMVDLNAAIQEKPIVIYPALFLEPSVQAVVPQIMRQMRPQGQLLDNVCICAAHLFPPDTQFTSAMSQQISDVQDLPIQSGVDDIFLSPDTSPAMLRVSIKAAHIKWTANQRTMQDVMQRAMEDEERENGQLAATHRKLLWEEIPRQLMPQFSRLNPDLLETESSVGDYDKVTPMKCKRGSVWIARSPTGRKVALKINEKKDVTVPGVVESIYREYRFLSGLLQHPNIISALDFLHGPQCVYMVFNYAGDQNLTQHLSGLPGNAMHAEVALRSFAQIASAMAYCHEKNITHRAVSLDHIVVDAKTDGSLSLSIVDFQCALLAKPDFICEFVTNYMPFLAPEVIDRPHHPIPADCWSVGVVLLEMAGGMGCMAKALGLTAAELLIDADDDHLFSAEAKVNAHSNFPGIYAEAVQQTGHPNAEIMEILAGLLQPVAQRSPMSKYGVPAAEIDSWDVSARSMDEN